MLVLRHQTDCYDSGGENNLVMMMKAWLVKLTNITFAKMSICHIFQFSQLLSFTCANHNYLPNFALAQHALVHLVQKPEILSESKRDTLYDPLSQLLACL